MKISMLRILLLFTICQNIILGSNQGFMKLTSGSIFMKSEGKQKWFQIKADISIRVGDWFKTSSDFRGSLYIANSSISLWPDRLFKFQRDGLYQKKGDQWYLVSNSINDIPKKQMKIREAKFRGRLIPELYGLLTRPGQFEKRKMVKEFDLFHGDIVVLPKTSRAEAVFVDGSQLHIDAGSSLEFGSEGIFLNSGSVFCAIKKRLSRFEVTTANLLVAVRGTTFEVSHSMESRVKVFEGVVKVSDRSFRNRPIFLKRGQQALTYRKDHQILSSEFKEIDRPAYSKVILNKNLETQNYDLGQRVSELRNLRKIQSELGKSKEAGFNEFVLPNVRDDNSTMNRESLIELEKPSLQDYLRRVANPGEDADFEIFKGGKAGDGVGKIVESWKDDYRNEVQSSTVLQREKLDVLAEDFKSRRELVEDRGEKLSVDLRTQVQQEDFSRRAFGRGVREVDDKNVTNREILNLRKLRNTQNLALKRIQQDKLRLVRDKELIDRKIISIEQSLNSNPSQRSSLEATLSALRIQKRQLDTVQKNLNSRENNTQNVILKIDTRIQEVLKGFAGRFRKDDKFNKDSRRRLLGR